MAERFDFTSGTIYGAEALADMTDEELATEISCSETWEPELIQELAWRADLIDEYEQSDEDDVEEIAEKAAEALGVSIWDDGAKSWDDVFGSEHGLIIEDETNAIIVDRYGDGAEGTWLIRKELPSTTRRKLRKVAHIDTWRTEPAETILFLDPERLGAEEVLEILMRGDKTDDEIQARTDQVAGLGTDADEFADEEIKVYECCWAEKGRYKEVVVYIPESWK